MQDLAHILSFFFWRSWCSGVYHFAYALLWCCLSILQVWTNGPLQSVLASVKALTSDPQSWWAFNQLAWKGSKSFLPCLLQPSRLMEQKRFFWTFWVDGHTASMFLLPCWHAEQTVCNDAWCIALGAVDTNIKHKNAARLARMEWAILSTQKHLRAKANICIQEISPAIG